MYLLAFVTDIKTSWRYNYNFEGNLPKKTYARNIYIASGFLDYVNSAINLSKDSTRIKIKKGMHTSSEIVQNICDFVHQASGLRRTDTTELYEILIELMNNTTQHAYINELNELNESPSAHSWFIYAENTESTIKFVFLDTGAGIPDTVRRKRLENVFTKTDAQYIRSALRGEYRSSTKQKFRGKGLPQIAACFKSGLIQNVAIFSGRGSCILGEDLEFDLSDNNERLAGTLFSWEIKKERKR